MSRIDEILAKQKALADELAIAKLEERDAVLKDIKEKIKLFNVKTTDFKGVLTHPRTFNQRITNHRSVGLKSSFDDDSRT